jgi:hypothetical protein
MTYWDTSGKAIKPIQHNPFLLQLPTISNNNKTAKKNWVQYFWDFGLQILLNPIYWLFKRL